MDVAPPRLYPPENATATSEIPTRLFVRADDGAADTHESRWDFNGDGTWDTGWLDGVETTHIYNAVGRRRVRVGQRLAD